MSRSRVATEAGIQLVEHARMDKCWSKQDLAKKVELDRKKGISLQTVEKFLKGGRIDSPVFSAICKVLDLNWRDVAGVNTKEPPPPSLPSLDLQREYEGVVQFWVI